MLKSLFYLYLVFSCSQAWSSANVESLDLSLIDQDFSIERYPSKGEHLLLWLSSGFETSNAEIRLMQQLSQSSVEVWYVDLLSNLFLSRNVNNMRSFRGKYVAELITKAHQTTGKRITLVGRAYGAIAALYGAHRWQSMKRQEADILNGAILFSPELIQTVPALGQQPEFMPIVHASNIPIMIFQSGKRGNRGQLNNLVEALQQNSNNVYLKIFKDVTSLFSDRDTSPATIQARAGLARDIMNSLKLLQALEVPEQVIALKKLDNVKSRGLDISLKKYTADPVPQSLNLYDAKGNKLVRNQFKAKVTVVNFWATWCPPCVEEIPSLNNLMKKMQHRPFELISVNYAEEVDKISLFLQQVKVDFPVLLDKDGKVSADWNVVVFPSTFVIGPDGLIQYGVNGAIHWDSPEVVEQLDQLYKYANSQ